MKQKTITNPSTVELDNEVNKFREGVNAVATQTGVFVVKDIPYFVATVFYEEYK